jgi:hypothetical protein
MAGFAVALCGAQAALNAQDFSLFGRKVQTHGFVQQGFLYTGDTNNYLTMQTNSGSFGMTDTALNLSSQITDKFHVGGQAYYGHLGVLKNSVHLDWAVGDYKFKSWFGVRAGKVKTVLGLFTDTQDAEFLHTFALMPQAIYPVDLRNASIAHIGGDVYGDIAPGHAGTFSYTAYYGQRPNDPEDGLLYTVGKPNMVYTGPMVGADLRWSTPIKGVLVGASYLTQHPSGKGLTSTGLPYNRDDAKDQTSQYYVQYSDHGLEIDGEYNRHHGTFVSAGRGALQDFFSWYTSAAYRINKRLEFGGYYSRFFPDLTVDFSGPDGHIYDKVLTMRVDLTNHWNVKVEGHLMDGFADAHSARGIYVQTNPQGEVPKTNILIIRTAFYF